MNDEKKELLLQQPKANRIWTAWRHGFTLVELLVVIAVIGILSSLLLPGLSQARQRAGSAGCKNNLRQWGLALNMYTSDYDVYPPYSMTDSKPELLQSWHKRLEKYAGASIDVCPAYARRSGLTDDSHCSYGYNRSGVSRWGAKKQIGLGGDSTPGTRPIMPENLRLIRENEVLHPSDMIAVGDAILSTEFNDRPGWRGLLGWSDLSPIHHSSIWKEIGLPHRDHAEIDSDLRVMKARHGGRWNVVFCDGHVEDLTIERLFDVRRENVLKRWNRDNLPHRELIRPFPGS